MDRIHDLLIDDNLLNNMPGDRPNEPAHMTFNDFKIPTLPNIDEIIDETEKEDEEQLPYDAGLKALTKNEVIEDYQPVNTINDTEEDSLSEEDINNDNEEINEEDDSFDDDLLDIDDLNLDIDDEDENTNTNEDTDEESSNLNSLKDFDLDDFEETDKEDNDEGKEK